MRIGVDLDGTVYAWERAARWFLCHLRGHALDGPLTRESERWDYIEQNVSPEDWEWLWTEGVQIGVFAMFEWVYPDAIEVLRDLGTDHDLVVITKRPRTALVDTMDFLYGTRLPISELHVLHDGRQKSEVVPGCDVYIDDAPQIVGDLAANTEGKVLLIDRPWNRNVRYAVEPERASDLYPARVLRVRWSQVPHVVRYLKEGK